MRTESSRPLARRRWRRRGLRARGACVAAAGIAAAITVSTTVALAAKPTAPPGWKPGWLTTPASYVGRYELTAASSDGSVEKGARGELTLFMQVAYAGSPPIPAGIISLNDAKNTEVVYLTDLDHDGTRRLALVHGGAFVAPPIGSLAVSTLARGVLAGTLEERGFATLRLTFKRFSSSPQP